MYKEQIQTLCYTIKSMFIKLKFYSIKGLGLYLVEWLKL